MSEFKFKVGDKIMHNDLGDLKAFGRVTARGQDETGYFYKIFWYTQSLEVLQFQQFNREIIEEFYDRASQ